MMGQDGETNLEATDNEIKEEWDDGKQVHKVHWGTEELELSGGAGKSHLGTYGKKKLTILIKLTISSSRKYQPVVTTRSQGIVRVVVVGGDA